MIRVPWAVLIVLVMSVAFLPARLTMPGTDLDASWGGVLLAAARQSWQFGPEIAFTYGPLGHLAVLEFDPDAFGWSVGLRAMLGVACGWGYHVISRGAGLSAPVSTGLLCLLLTPTFAAFDTPWLLPAMLWPFVATSQDRWARQAAIGLAVAVGLVALVKFTTFALAMALAVLLVVDDLGRRRLPLASLTFVATVAVTWVLCGQSPANFLTWIRVSADLSSGFSEAMSTGMGPYQVRELLVFGAAAAMVLAAPLVRWCTGPMPWREVVHPALALALLVFMQFKLGFVRQDAHVTAAFFAMPLMAVLAVMPLLPRRLPRDVRAFAVAVLLVAFAAYAYGLRRHFDRATPPDHARAWLVLQAEAVTALLRPTTAHARLSAARAAALDALRQTLPLPPMDGGVDVYGHHQGAVLAYPIDYRPRPVFQSYAAYTPALAARNRAHLAGPGGPRHILFDPETIDFRYPLLDEASSLPTLAADFEPVAVVGRFAHLRRRVTARPVRLEPAGELALSPGQEWRLPETSGPLWAAATLERTWLGRLAALAHTLPPVVIDVRTADGTRHEYRLVRELASLGMLVSPLVTTPADMVAFMEGRAPQPGQRVVAWNLRPSWAGAYVLPMRVRLATWHGPHAPADVPLSAGPHDRSTARDARATGVADRGRGAPERSPASSASRGGAAPPVPAHR
jgi:hypothetical protein